MPKPKPKLSYSFTSWLLKCFYHKTNVNVNRWATARMLLPHTVLAKAEERLCQYNLSTLL